jgi:phage gp36-like protein
MKVATKVQEIMTKILASRKLNTERNRNRYKEIIRLIKGKSLAAHVKIGVYSMDVFAKTEFNGLKIESGYMISLRTDNRLMFNTNGSVKTYNINSSTKCH